MNPQELANDLGIKHLKPREYQCEAHAATAHHIRKSKDPAFLDVTVGGGKSLLIAMICKQAQLRGMKVLVLARQGELVEQNASELWECGVKNSIYSASLGIKSTHFPIVVGTEGSVAKALNGDLADFTPDILLIDEAHMVGFDSPESQYMVIIEQMKHRNNKLRIIGYTGSPYRGVQPMLGSFWKKSLSSISTEQLVAEGFLVPTLFGDTDEGYDLSEFKSQGLEGDQDYTQSELNKMQDKILGDLTKTQSIMQEVQALAAKRNGVLITCAGEKHCIEASKHLPKGSFGIVTSKTKKKDRRDILKKAYNGDIKYIFQVGCLTTGVNIPLWDTSVILRKIGSLTLLVQLLGRGMRLLKQGQIDAGVHKADHLVLDYSDTMSELGELYNNPMLEEAEFQRASREMECIECPKCAELNSEKARRCRGSDPSSIDGRCEHFWQSSECTECSTENDVAARYCRNCDAPIRDPNENLSSKRYTDAEWVTCDDMTVSLTRDGKGVLITWFAGDGRKATKVFYPQTAKGWQRAAFYNEFLAPYIGCRHMSKRYFNVRDASTLVKMKAVFNKPTFITIRQGKYGDIVRARFIDGKVTG